MEKKPKMVRFPEYLKDKIEQQAGRLGISVNAYIIFKMEEVIEQEEKKQKER